MALEVNSRSKFSREAMAQQIYSGPKFLMPSPCKQQANSMGLFTPGHLMRFL